MISFVSGDLPATLNRLVTVARFVEEDSLILGSHLEGPFLASARRGAHAQKYLASPDADTVVTLLEKGGHTLRQVTFEPELLRE